MRDGRWYCVAKSIKSYRIIFVVFLHLALHFHIVELLDWFQIVRYDRIAIRQCIQMVYVRQLIAIALELGTFCVRNRKEETLSVFLVNNKSNKNNNEAIIIATIKSKEHQLHNNHTDNTDLTVIFGVCGSIASSFIASIAQTYQLRRSKCRFIRCRFWRVCVCFRTWEN